MSTKESFKIHTFDFRSGEDKSKDELPNNNIITSDPNVVMEEQIDRILKEFGFNEMFRPGKRCS